MSLATALLQHDATRGDWRVASSCPSRSRDNGVKGKLKFAHLVTILRRDEWRIADFARVVAAPPGHLRRTNTLRERAAPGQSRGGGSRAMREALKHAYTIRSFSHQSTQTLLPTVGCAYAAEHDQGSCRTTQRQGYGVDGTTAALRTSSSCSQGALPESGIPFLISRRICFPRSAYQSTRSTGCGRALPWGPGPCLGPLLGPLRWAFGPTRFELACCVDRGPGAGPHPAGGGGDLFFHLFFPRSRDTRSSRDEDRCSFSHFHIFDFIFSFS